jgi:hypothetical protein
MDLSSLVGIIFNLKNIPAHGLALISQDGRAITLFIHYFLYACTK